MQFKSIKLENIRSYLNQKIDFPVGSLLLSGDIGSGKSSILLAIDFSLFGLTRGVLSGSSLLRNGKNHGSVELSFSIDGKDITIKRTLRREADKILQDSGFIIIDGKKKEATATELKQIILQLLNYPPELLTKSKDLIYRYTVYTPQEEMKQILLGDKDFRLDTLRKVFGIDKYKRINQNTELFIGNLKGKRKEFDGMIFDLANKKKEKKSKLKEAADVEKKIKVLLPNLEKFKESVETKKEEIKKIEEKISDLKELKKKFEVADVDLKNKILQTKKNKDEISSLNKQIKELQLELKESKKSEIEKLKKEKAEKERQLDFFEDTTKKINNKVSSLQTKKENSENLKKEIPQLGLCPTCKQKVTKQHINYVIKVETGKIEKFLEDIKINEQQLKEAEKNLDKIKNELESLRKQEHESEILKLKIDSLEEKNKLKENLLQQQNDLKKEIGVINSEKLELVEKIENLKDVEKIYEKANNEFENLREQQKEIEIKKASFDTELQSLNSIIENLENEIQNKLKIKANLDYLSQLQHWLEAYFIKLIGMMEKKIMLRVHSDFNNLFQKWFDMLVEDETLAIKLDEEFTPIIVQNQHEIDYNFLSGGEKTAAALAYRLALNQVINTLISVIKTKDLLILDEPTDGFSTEQLDRVKLVLDELETKQTILVSHEAKVESFVDNVVKLEKKEHISEVVV